MTGPMENTYWASADALSLATQLARARDLPAPEELQQRIGTMFEVMARRFREDGLADDDLNNARYALCAFMDEQVLRSSWPGRQQWLAQPLQLVYFNENTAGEGFFARMEALERQPNRGNVLQIYYLCLALGFQGKYAVHSREAFGALFDHVSAEVDRSLIRTDVISPHGESRDPARSFVRSERPIVALSIGFFAFSLFVFVALKLFLLQSTSSTVGAMNKSSAGIFTSSATRGP